MMKMRLDYGLYMAEKEGLLNTRESRINAVIKDCEVIGKHGAEVISFDEFNEVLHNHGLTYDSLTPKEISRIQRGY